MVNISPSKKTQVNFYKLWLWKPECVQTSREGLSDSSLNG